MDQGAGIGVFQHPQRTIGGLCHIADSLADICKRSHASSVHVTFLTEEEWQMLGSRNYLQRTHRQFHCG